MPFRPVDAEAWTSSWMTAHNINGDGSGDVTVAVPARGRTTLNLSATFTGPPFHPDGRLYPVLVESLGDAPPPIVAERSIYANTLNAIWELGSNTFLTPLPPSSSSVSTVPDH